MKLPHLQNVIIFRGSDAWYLDHSVDPSGPSVFRSFGTYVLPMPYSAAMPEDTVKRNLAARNPGVKIAVQLSILEPCAEVADDFRLS